MARFSLIGLLLAGLLVGTTAVPASGQAQAVRVTMGIDGMV